MIYIFGGILGFLGGILIGIWVIGNGED